MQLRQSGYKNKNASSLCNSQRSQTTSLIQNQADSNQLLTQHIKSESQLKERRQYQENYQRLRTQLLEYYRKEQEQHTEYNRKLIKKQQQGTTSNPLFMKYSYSTIVEQDDEEVAYPVEKQFSVLSPFGLTPAQYMSQSLRQLEFDQNVEDSDTS